MNIFDEVTQAAHVPAVLFLQIVIKELYFSSNIMQDVSSIGVEQASHLPYSEGSAEIICRVSKSNAFFRRAIMELLMK